MPDPADKYAALLKLVRDVRNAQRRYFRERTAKSLTESKLLEAALDKMIEDSDDEGKLFR